MLVEFQSTALHGADLVANRTGLLVILRFNRPLKGRTQSLELEVAFGGPPKILRNLTYMRLSTMDVHKQRFEVLLEDHVVIGATKSPPFSKLGKRDAAHRASLLVGLGQFAGRFFQLQLLRKQTREGRGRLERLARLKKHPSVILTQMDKRRA